MPTPDHTRWADKQVGALIALGVNPLDAQASVKAFLQLLPPGADPNTYIVPPRYLEQELYSQVPDARAAWFGEVEPRYVRLLDATEEGE